MMYEFTKKEIRNRFKRTKIGKTINKALLISFVLLMISSFALGVVEGYIEGSEETISKSLETTRIICLLLTFIFYSMTIYIDGRRDGAIDQFKTQK